MFAGTYNLYIDGARIFVPKEILDEIGSTQITLFLDPDKQWIVFYDKDSLEELHRTLPLDPGQLSENLSKILANGHKATIDKKRRVALPKGHMEGAGLKNHCLLVGQGRFCILKADSAHDI